MYIRRESDSEMIHETLQQLHNRKREWFTFSFMGSAPMEL